MNTAVHFSSATDEWSTPQNLFDQLNAIYQFTLDVCATPENAKCNRFYTEADNGLLQPWRGRVWCNPPYGREIGKWVQCAVTATEQWGPIGRTADVVVMLLPARTDTRWWHEYVIPYGQITFLRGRLKFGGAKTSAPFPSAIVVFGGVR